METKVCNKCGLEKEITLFGKNKSTKSGYAGYCKECGNKRRKEIKKQKRELFEKGEIKIKITEKVCLICKQLKPISCFSFNYSTSDLHSFRCKDCDKEYKKQYSETHQEFLKERRAYFRNRDIEKSRQRRREEYKRHREHYLAYQKEYRSNNLEMIKARDKKYNETHKEQIRLQKQKSHWNKYCTDITKIENYEKAKADDFKGWVRHHRLETHNSDGEKRFVELTPAELKVLGVYYKRPPEELIWVTREEHLNLHREYKKC